MIHMNAEKHTTDAATNKDWENYWQKRYLSRNRLLLDHHQLTLRKFLDFFSEVDINKRILDIGCGDGFWMEQLRNLGFENLVGMDMSNTSLERAQQKNLNVFRSDAEALAFQHEFDFVIMCDVLEHLPHPDRVLKRVRDALVPSGTLYITLPVCHSFRDKWRRFLHSETRLKQSQQWDSTHVNAWNQQSLTALLERTGFSVICFRHHYNTFPIVGVMGAKIVNLLSYFTVGGRFGRTASIHAIVQQADNML